MIVTVGSEELARLCSSSRDLDRRFGKPRAALVRQRLSEVAGCPTVAGLIALPALRCVRRSEAGLDEVLAQIDRTLSLVLRVIDDKEVRVSALDDAPADV